MSVRVSICIPTYNGERYLKECLDSALSQSFSDTEILIVDDGSTDATLQIAEEYGAKDPRIRIHRNQTNLGLVENWNKCLDLAKGEWIKFLFQDDILRSDCLEKMIATAGKQLIVVTDRIFLFEQGTAPEIQNYYNSSVLRISTLIPEYKEAFVVSPERVSEIAAGNVGINFIGEPSCVMFKKELINTDGLFDKDLSQICDLEFWLRLCSSHGLVFIPEKLVSFRVHGASATAANALGKPKYRSRFLDPVILVYKFLHDQTFLAFRKNITQSEVKKLEVHMRVKLYEAKKELKEYGEKDKLFFEDLLKRKKELSAAYHSSFNTRLLFSLIKIKRKLRY